MLMSGAADYANALDRAMTAIYAGKDIKNGLDDAAKEWDSITNKLGVDNQRRPTRSSSSCPGATASQHGLPSSGWRCTSRSGAGGRDRHAQTTIRRRRPRAVSSWMDRHIRWLLVSPAVAAHPRADDLPARLLGVGQLRPVRLLGLERASLGRAAATSGTTWQDPVWVALALGHGDPRHACGRGRVRARPRCSHSRWCARSGAGAG